MLAGVDVRAVTLPTPIAAEVYVKGETKATALRGKLTSYDESGFTLHTAQNEDKTLNWSDITPASAYALRFKTVDRQQAQSWIDLGKFAWSLNLKDQAKSALKSAVHLDASRQAEVDEILATKPGSMLSAGPATRPSGELINSSSTPAPAAAKPDAAASTDKPATFKPATPEESAEAIAYYHKQADEVQTRLGLQFQSFETDHFLVFTNWDEREKDFMKTNLEMAYKVVARQFEQSPKDNVFVGKLPVYMFDKYGQFAEFAQKVDEWPVNERVAGYYGGRSNGIGHMAMWKPNESLTGTSNINDAKRLWAYVLVHEFTHAFLARYRTNVFVPRWLNEGIAEVIATGEFPSPDHARMAHLMAIETKEQDLMFLFDAKGKIPSGEYYPVMQSMTELLIRDNKANFLKLINAIKDGEDCESALQKYYNTDYANLAHIWREWARRH